MLCVKLCEIVSNTDGTFTVSMYFKAYWLPEKV